ncbi:MAG: hypothetical protein ABIS86_21740 [Streptosporangiaceae bacterium]
MSDQPCSSSVNRFSGALPASGGRKDHGWGSIREDRIFFHDLRVRRATEFIASTGIAQELQDLVTARTGRPRTCTVEGLLVGMTLCSRRNGSVAFNQVTDILFWGIPEEWRRRFGLTDKPDDRDGFEAAYGVVLRLFHAILAQMDPSPLPKNSRLPLQEAAAYAANADTDALAVREDRLDRICGTILQASVASIAHLMHEHWDGSLGVDATVIATFARGVRTDPLATHTSTDTDAGWYVREGDHADPHRPNPAGTGRANRKRTRNHPKFLFGYDATLAVTRNPHHIPNPALHGLGDPTEIPALVLGMKLGKPGHRPGAIGIKILTDIRGRGWPAGHLAGDAAYNNSKPKEWQLPLLALGYRPSYDYRSDQLGIQGSAYGAPLIEGSWACPSMPQHLIDATTDLHRPDNDPARIDPETWSRRINARTPYLLPAKGHPDEEGHQRRMCPAAAGKVQCPLKPASMGTNPALPLIQPVPSPVRPPKICEQTSITLAPEFGAKQWQYYPYGGPQWQQTYGKLRNAVEGMNGYTKNDAHEAIERAQNRRIRGIAAQSILLAFQLARANQRKIDAWTDTFPGANGIPRRRARRRTTQPLGTWTPKGHLEQPAG